MRLAARASIEQLRTERGRRVVGIAAALLLELLLLALLLSLNSVSRPPAAQRPLVTEFDASESEDEAKSPEPEPEKAKPAQASAPPQVQPSAEPLPPSPLTPPPAPIIQTPNLAPLPPLARPTAPPAPAPSPLPPGVRLRDDVSGPAAPGPSEGDSQRVGTAPNGEPLYAAKWYREPYPEELRGYLSTASGPGWGLIACKTAPDFRVEDCVPLAESPSGSNINRAVLAAAWQFKVRPPRRGGQSLIGAWVRIRIDYDLKPAADRRR